MRVKITLDDQRNTKRNELLDAITGTLTASPNQNLVAEHILNTFCEIDAPTLIHEMEDYDPNPPMHYITFNSPGFTGRGGGTSRKAGNVVLNLKKIMEGFGEGILTVLGGNVIPFNIPLPAPFNVGIGIPLAVIIVARKLSANVSINIDEKHAAVFAALWSIRDTDSRLVSGVNKYDRINEVIKTYGITPITKSDYDFVIQGLSDINSISLQSDGSILLTEDIKNKY